jgi:hypothetical protein
MRRKYSISLADSSVWPRGDTWVFLRWQLIAPYSATAKRLASILDNRLVRLSSVGFHQAWFIASVMPLMIGASSTRERFAIGAQQF